MRVIGILLVLVILSGCGGGRPTESVDTPGASFVLGFTVDDTGTIKTLSGKNYRESYEQRFQSLLDQHLGAGWTARVHIVPDAGYLEPESDDVDGWFWHRAQVTVALIGDGRTPAPRLGDDADPAVIRDRIIDFVGQIMRTKMQPTAPLGIRVQARCERPDGSPATVTGFDLAEPEPVGPTVANGPPTPRPSPPTDGPRRYTVQQGDTLAIISEVFYGSSDHWRQILQANPGLTFHLVAGTVIVIPALPEKP